MEKSFDPHAIEQRWYDSWEKQELFAPTGDGEPYCILIPPPNVTGTLHMGHAFQHTLMDALVRYHRMRGNNTLWQPGTDHAGIATQMVVERQLQADGQSRHDLGREEFIEKVWQWKNYSGGTITSQMRRLGDSTNWRDEWFTMDEPRSLAVTEVFVRLHSAGLIEKRERLVNWDPVLHTAISDLEVISEEEDGHLWHLRYPVEDSDEFVTVATTRPETMLGDTAVALHPEDERYRHLHGKFAILPLTGRRIPIVLDDYVDPEFGSGCVKITPAHDFNDWELGQRHDLEVINLFTPNADMNDNVPEQYRGMDRNTARKQVVADLEAAGNLLKVDKHKLVVPRGDRSGTIIEPYLTDQWYLKMEALARPAIDAVTNGDISFVPDNWKNTYFHWMNNLQDWCISRQLWWGHRIPAWYDGAGKVYVGRNEAEVRAAHSLADSVVLEQDPDVLDTWFSSALLPFTTLDWDGESMQRGHWLPSNVLVTGFDIIFFWVARMIMMTLHFTDKVPFREIYITGLIRDEHGQKMSKSKGNILDPIDLIDGIDVDALVEKRTTGLMQPHLKPKIEKNTRKTFPEGIKSHGTDALRFTLAALASPSRDINFDMGRLEGYRNFCNKLWNASRYVLMNTEGEDCKPGKLSTADIWIRNRLGNTILEVEKSLAKYRFDLAAKELHDFTWNYFCDWYLELSKPVLQSETASAEEKRGTRHTLVTVLESLLKVSHPFMPFITEEIWQRVAPLAGVEGESIMVQPWPVAAEFCCEEHRQAEPAMEWVMQFIDGLRRVRADLNISPSRPLAVILENAGESDLQHLENQAPLIRFLARLESIESAATADEIPQSATALLGNMKIHVPMAGLVDAKAEIARLEKQLQKIDAELESVRNKLANEKFVNNAPPVIVEKEQQRVTDLAEKREQLLALSQRMANL